MLENNLKCRDKVYHCEELVKIIKIDVLFMYFAAQMKKILNFEINKKHPKSTNGARSLAGLHACTHHAHTRAHSRRQYQTGRVQRQLHTREAARTSPDKIHRPGRFIQNLSVHRFKKKVGSTGF